MPRFDVYANPVPSERRQTPYFLDVQNDYVDSLGTRVVIPLRKSAAFGLRARNLNPVVKVGHDELVLDTAALGAVPTSILHKPVASLSSERGTIQEALDTLFGSY